MRKGWSYVCQSHGRQAGWSAAFHSPFKKRSDKFTDTVTQMGGKESKLQSSLNRCTKINFGCQRTLCKIF